MHALLTTLLATVPCPQQLPELPARPHAVPALAVPLADGRTTPFDQPEPGGPWWTRGSNFKASFAADGWTFLPQPPAGAATLEPIRFRLTNLAIAGTVMPLAANDPQRSGQRLAYDHGAVLETLDVDGGGIEQQFVLRTLPARGEVQVGIEVVTDLPATTEPRQIVFASRGGPVTYSHAVAFDAAGRRIDCPTTFTAGRITIRVPAEFVAAAAAPLVIDPRVAFAVPASGNSDFADPDVACCRFTTLPPSFVHCWLVVYANWFGATDWDCYVQVYDPDLVPLAGPYVIDLSTDGWMRPRIASMQRQTLIVAEVRAGSAAHRIAGRRAWMASFGPSLSLGSPFAISFDTVDCLRPDVGGNPGTLFPFQPAYYTVVWERAFSATDHDIYARQVDTNGALRPGPIAIQADGLHQTRPAIGKTCGPTFANPPTVVTARFAIAWQQTAWAGNEDIHGAMLTWDGWQVAVNGSYTFPIDTSVLNDVNPAVSSPSLQLPDSNRLLLAAYERTNSGNGDIVATCFRSDGTLLAQGNVSQLENDPTRLSWPQRRPSVDGDGQRFAVAYHDLYQNQPTANDLDTRVSLVALAGNQLVVSEPGAILGFSGNREFHVEIASIASGLGGWQPGYCTTNDRDNTNNTFAIDVRTYAAAPANTFATRPTACGTTTLAATGNTVLGGSLTFTAALPGEFVVVLIGATATAPLPGCGTCVLGVANTAAFASPAAVQIPTELTLIGAQLAAQGLALTFANPQCFGYLQLSDTIDFTIQ